MFGLAGWLLRSVWAYLACAVLAALPAWAGFVTTNQAELDAIYSQKPAFDDAPIDIRFNPSVTINDPALLTIDTEQQLEQLFALGGNNSPTVDMFFVDSINECGGEQAPPIVGCGAEPGNKLVVESAFAAGSLGAALMGHELGHNLGLDHVTSSDNLMYPILTGHTVLTESQVGTILGSPLMQMDNGQRFILITPFAIVPEPSSMLFALTGAVVMLRLTRRRTAA